MTSFSRRDFRAHDRGVGGTGVLRRGLPRNVLEEPLHATADRSQWRLDARAEGSDLQHLGLCDPTRVSEPLFRGATRFASPSRSITSWAGAPQREDRGVAVVQPIVVREEPRLSRASQIAPHTWRIDRWRVVEQTRRRFLDVARQRLVLRLGQFVLTEAVGAARGPLFSAVTNAQHCCNALALDFGIPHPRSLGGVTHAHSPAIRCRRSGLQRFPCRLQQRQRLAHAVLGRVRRHARAGDRRREGRRVLDGEDQVRLLGWQQRDVRPRLQEAVRHHRRRRRARWSVGCTTATIAR